MKLEEAFERIVVINLPFKTDRRQRLERHLQEIGIADPSAIRWERGICGDWAPGPSWWGAGNGAWGCLMSHLRVGQDAIHDGVANYCVLEDDVVFHPRAPEILDRFMAGLPTDWGQAYLGGQFLHREPEIVAPGVMRPYNVNRTHAFALSKDTIPRFLQHIMHAPDYYEVTLDDGGDTSLSQNCFHIDHQLGRAHERCDWNTYAPTWWIAGQEEGRSNISGRRNPRLWWHWRDRGHSLPFFFLDADPSKGQRDIAQRYLHAGYNTIDDTLTDVGLQTEMSDEELLGWLRMIAGEAVEQWRLPGLEIPRAFPDLGERISKIWEPGLVPASEKLMMATIEYPFNGLCGGMA